MRFMVQNCPPRDPWPLFERLQEQDGRAWPNGVVGLAVDTKRIGQLRTMVAILECGLENARGVTLVEDDVEVCADFLPYVRDHWWEPAKHVVQWFVPGDFDLTVRNGWAIAPGSRYLYNQATTFSPEACAAILASPRLEEWKLRGAHGGDEVVAAVLADYGWDYAIRVPGGVQHLGADTLVTPNPNPLRQGQRLRGGLVSKLYVGRDGRMGAP